jgi:outer membrane lipoprotein LolB
VSARARCAHGIAAVAAAVVLLGACAQLPMFGAARSGTPEAFEAQGRVYVRYGTRAFAGTLRWRHALEADEVWLGGPLGQTAAHIVRDSGGATLTTADQQVYRATSIESLTREGLGWSLPLADLSHYVVGAAPVVGGFYGVAAVWLRAPHHDGWSVRWVTLTEGADAAAPGRIELSRDDVEIRFVVDRLERNPAP